jgi:hypothetical protein
MRHFSRRPAYPSSKPYLAVSPQIPGSQTLHQSRGELLENRRRLMAEWAKFCGEVRAPEDKVVAINKARRELLPTPLAPVQTLNCPETLPVQYNHKRFAFSQVRET